MRKSIELKQKADAIYSDAKVILAKIDTEKRDPTDQEMVDLKAMNDNRDKLTMQAREFERMENAEAGRDSATLPTQSLDDPEAEEKPRKAAKVFQTLGHQLQAIYAVATGKLTAGLNSVEEARNKLMAAASGGSEAVDSDGGALLQPEFSSDIEDIMEEQGKILALCTSVSLSGNRLVERYIDETSRVTGSRGGAVQGYWVNEADAITASKVKFGRRTTELEKVAALGYATSELLEDFPAMSGIYTEEFAEELVFLTEDAIIEGSGSGKPLGILNAPCLISVSKETGQAAATIVTTNLSKMWVRMPSRSKANAVWIINNECNPQLDEMTIPAGTAAVEPRFVNYGPDGILRIKGRPVIEVEYCSAVGNVGDIILADFSQYRLIGKGGINQQQSIHVRFVNDEVAFRATYRVGGQPKPKVAITPFKGTATLSPFVALSTRA